MSAGASSNVRIFPEHLCSYTASLAPPAAAVTLAKLNIEAKEKVRDAMSPTYKLDENRVL